MLNRFWFIWKNIEPEVGSYRASKNMEGRVPSFKELHIILFLFACWGTLFAQTFTSLAKKQDFPSRVFLVPVFMVYDASWVAVRTVKPDQYDSSHSAPFSDLWVHIKSGLITPHLLHLPVAISNNFPNSVIIISDFQILQVQPCFTHHN